MIVIAATIVLMFLSFLKLLNFLVLLTGASFVALLLLRDLLHDLFLL
jgi:hypothetical protein